MILDLYSRAVVGWAMSRRLDRALAIDALTMAIARRGVAPGILHSDRGTLYAVAQYRALLVRHGIRQSMSRKADCWDNARMERFFHTLKTELVHHCDYPTREAVRSSHVRIHGGVLQPSATAFDRKLSNPAGIRSDEPPLITVSTIRGQDHSPTPLIAGFGCNDRSI